MLSVWERSICGSGQCRSPQASNALFPSFRCRSSVAVSPFCRCKIPLFCKNYVRQFRYITAVNGKKIRNGSGNGVRKRERRNSNGRTATEWWKLSVRQVEMWYKLTVVGLFVGNLDSMVTLMCAHPQHSGARRRCISVGTEWCPLCRADITMIPRLY